MIRQLLHRWFGVNYVLGRRYGYEVSCAVRSDSGWVARIDDRLVILLPGGEVEGGNAFTTGWKPYMACDELTRVYDRAPEGHGADPEGEGAA